MLRLTLVACLMTTAAMASEDIPDQYPQSVLYSQPVEVIPHVWTSIGATAPPTYENAGHNNNLSFIVTGDGVIVVNSGASWKLAEALHAEIKSVTDQPVKLVINENGQGHAMLGNGYWAAQNVPILAHVDAAAEFEDGGDQGLIALRGYAKENAEDTVLAMPTETFTDKKVIEMGAACIGGFTMNRACNGKACAMPLAFCRGAASTGRSCGPMVGWPASIGRVTGYTSSAIRAGPMRCAACQG